MRPIRTAELLAIGSELTVGETRDTNSGDLARQLTDRGVRVGRLTALPDDLETVRDALLVALARSDLVVATGGLGPTPDDLTRESIAAALGETPAVDPALETWLRGLFDRRGTPFPEINLKQAWLIPSAVAVPNENGTAPGWWVEAPGERLIVALPGPPREMRPMWDGWVLPRLVERGLGTRSAVTTLRLTGIGESAIAARLGSLLDRGANPLVATYARADAVDVRISAEARDGAEDPEAVVAAAEARILEELGEHVWGRGETTWPVAVAEALDARGWRLAVVEVGTRGALTALLGDGLGNRLAFAETLTERPAPHDGHAPTLEHLAARGRELGGTGCEVGVAVEARERGGDTAATVAVVAPNGEHRETRLVPLVGAQSRGRAAIAAAAVLLARLRDQG